MYRASYFTAIPFCVRRVRIGSGPPPLHETKIPLHRTTVVKMISPASRDAGRPPSYSYPLFLPAETPRFIGWIPPRIGKLLADPGSDLIVINRYYCSGRRQHFYARSFGLMCRAIIQTESSRIDRVFLDQKIHRSLGFFFFFLKWKSIVENLYIDLVLLLSIVDYCMYLSRRITDHSFRACSLTLTRWNISGRSER